MALALTSTESTLLDSLRSRFVVCKPCKVKALRQEDAVMCKLCENVMTSPTAPYQETYPTIPAAAAPLEAAGLPLRAAVAHVADRAPEQVGGIPAPPRPLAAPGYEARSERPPLSLAPLPAPGEAAGTHASPERIEQRPAPPAVLVSVDQRAVLLDLCRGRHIRTIPERLGVSPATVVAAIDALQATFRVRTRSELVTEAFRRDLFTNEDLRDVPRSANSDPDPDRPSSHARSIVNGPIHISDVLHLPMRAGLGRFIVIGKSGAGKTTYDSVSAEEFLRNNIPVCIIDALGNMWGLGSSEDGLLPGLSIPIFGGRHGDYPLHVCDAPGLARVIERGKSAILDLSQMGSLQEQQAFVAAFFTEFVNVAADVDEHVPMHIIVEESERWAPARCSSPEHFEVLAATSLFARTVRNFSIGWTFSTQRPQLLSHDIVSSASAFVVMLNHGRGTQDRIKQHAETWVGDDTAKGILSTIGGLKRGEAWLISDPSWLGDDSGEEHEPLRFKCRWRSTFNSAKVLDFGEVWVPPSARAEVDLEPFRPLFERKPAIQPGVEPVPAEAILPDPTSNEDLAVEKSGSPVDAEARRTIMRELLRGLGQRTTRPVLAALTGLPAASFESALQELINDEFVETRRGTGGGVSLTGTGLALLGIRQLPKTAASSNGGAGSKTTGTAIFKSLAKAVGAGFEIERPVFEGFLIRRKTAKGWERGVALVESEGR